MPKIHVRLAQEPIRPREFVGVPCVRCGRTSYQKHHVTYQPEQVVRICRPCHTLITTINTVMARFLYGKLDNNTRKRIWDIFMTIRKDDWPLIG